VALEHGNGCLEFVGDFAAQAAAADMVRCECCRGAIRQPLQVAEFGRKAFVLRQVVADLVPGSLGAREDMLRRPQAGVAFQCADRNDGQIHACHDARSRRAAAATEVPQAARGHGVRYHFMLP
jgi:hypothetical protein